MYFRNKFLLITDYQIPFSIESPCVLSVLVFSFFLQLPITDYPLTNLSTSQLRYFSIGTIIANPVHNNNKFQALINCLTFKKLKS